MKINELAKESYENVKRRTGKRIFYFGHWKDKLCEEALEWTEARDIKSSHCPEITEEEEETADVILVMLSYAASRKFDIEKILKIKHEFNLTRE